MTANLCACLPAQNDEDIKRFIESMRMKEIKTKVRDAMDDAKSTLDVALPAIELLKNERCVIAKFKNQTHEVYHTFFTYSPFPSLPTAHSHQRDQIP